MENRIGQILNNGEQVNWPARTINGNNYNRAYGIRGTIKLSDEGHFAVLDSAAVPQDVVNELKALCAPKKAAPAPTKKDGDK